MEQQVKQIILNQLHIKEIIDINSIYFNNYCQLIQENIGNNKELNYEKHHIIPKSYYKMFGLKINNTSENLVYLSRLNHIKAHYYLSLCSVGKFKASNVYATNCLCNTSKLNEVQLLIEQEGAEQLLNIKKEHQLLVSKTRLGSKHSEEWKQNLSKIFKERGSHKGSRNGMYGVKRGSPTKNTHWYNNGEIQVMISDEDIPCYKSNGFVKGRLKCRWYNHKKD